jgi:glucose-6-phosphate 1-dehydrogenase
MNTSDRLDPHIFVIFGGAGDLTWRKLMPALFDLSQSRSIPLHFAIIAVDRVEIGEGGASQAPAAGRAEVLARG